jgi:methanethiol S-methyltransferase
MIGDAAMTVRRDLVYMAYGGFAVVVFAVSALYGIGFVGNLVVPKTIDSGPAGSWALALTIDVPLMVAFGLQHSGMARASFKTWWGRRFPAAIERSTYVLIASLLLLALYGLWRPIPSLLWDVREPTLRTIIVALFWIGWIVTGAAAAATSHLEMVGLQQILDAIRGRSARNLTLTISGLYRMVRHPIYVGTLVAIWATPAMSVGHLIFALVATIYILLGAMLEERDLVRIFGEKYRSYQRRVRMLIPIPK